MSAFLQGYNTSVICCGAPASGKTHALSGTITSYSDRGLVPRIISQVMRALENQMSREEVVVKTTYVEIQNEAMYDLVCRDTSSDGSIKI